MENKQEQEWKIAQNINVSIDLVSAAKQHIKFLGVIDSNSWIFRNPHALQRAIYRYKTCWIPLLAKHMESLLFEGPLVVPLDCEWIWHSHRLNPITYRSDCQALYNKFLDNKNVVSFSNEVSTKETEDVWNSLYPNEPFLLYQNCVENDKSEELADDSGFTNYDLTFAAKRQSLFYFQVADPHMSNDVYLEEAVARYKGFLHLIKRNIEMKINSFSAPTYDIDLIWHTHQLHPSSYSSDLENYIGVVLGHDDTVTDRTKGRKLDVGFTRTINTWAQMYGSRYRRAGAMHKFSTPILNSEKLGINSDEENKTNGIQELKVIEVMLEFVDVKDIPEEHQTKQFFVSFSKTQHDDLFKGKRTLPISSEEDVDGFKCQPTGGFIFELMAQSTNNKEIETLGSCSIYLEDILLPKSSFMFEKWMELTSPADCKSINPISLRVAMSVTPPSPAPLSLYLKTNVSPCVIPSESNVSSESKASPCCLPNVQSESKASPCCLPNVQSESKASPCCLPNVQSESKASPFCLPNVHSEIKASPCCLPNVSSESKASPCCLPNVQSESKASPCCLPNVQSESKASPCCLPNVTSESKASPCCLSNVQSESKASPCCLPNVTSESKASPCCLPNVQSESKASPCCLPNVTSESKASPCCLPNVQSESKASPCCLPNVQSESKASPCCLPNIQSERKASPCCLPNIPSEGKIDTKEISETKASPCDIPLETKSRPCGIPFVVIIGANATSGTNNHAFLGGTNDSGCTVHGTKACACGIPCA